VPKFFGQKRSVAGKTLTEMSGVIVKSSPVFGRALKKFPEIYSVI